MKNIAAILLIMVFFASCNKSNEEVQPEQPVPMAELKVSSDFNWKTTREAEIEIKGFMNGLVEVTSSKGKVYQKAFYKPGVPLVLKVTLPSYEESVFLVYLGQKAELKLTSAKLSYEFKIQ